MADARWKQIEREVAKFLSGVRTNRDRGMAVEDVTHPLFCIQVKHGHQIPRWVIDTYAQAVSDTRDDKVPLAVVHPWRWRTEDSLCILSLKDLHHVLQLAVQQDRQKRSQIEKTEAGTT